MYHRPPQTARRGPDALPGIGRAALVDRNQITVGIAQARAPGEQERALAMARIIVADVDQLHVRGLKALLESAMKDIDIRAADALGTLLEELERSPPADLALIDIAIAGEGEINVLRDLRRSFSSTRFMIMSGSESLETALDALSAGLHGIISKAQSDDETVQAVLDVLRGGTYVPPWIVQPFSEPLGGRPVLLGIRQRRPQDPARLTTRQREVLTLVAKGLSNRQIARVLDIAEPTTKIHVSALMRVLGVRNRTEAAVLARAWLDVLPAVPRPVSHPGNDPNRDDGEPS